MRASRWWIVPAVLAGGLALSACSRAQEAAPEPPPARVAQILVAGTRHQGVRLTERAAERLGVETAPVRAAPGGKLLIPAAAVEYNNDGTAFTYTSPEPLAYVQQPITIDSVAADQAVLSAGPTVGTPEAMVMGCCT